MAEPTHQISELRGEELEDVVAFAEQQQAAVDRSTLRRRLSVVARDGEGTLVGAVFCHSGGSNSVAMELVVSDRVEDHAALARLLIDKTLLKLRCENVHRCAVRMPGEESAQHIWHTARWICPAPPEDTRAA